MGISNIVFAVGMSGLGPGTVDGLFEAHALHPVDTSRAKDGVWLVKVPNYLADLWLKSNTDRVVGKVVIFKEDNGSGSMDPKHQSDIRLVTDESLFEDAGEGGNLIPKVCLTEAYASSFVLFVFHTNKLPNDYLNNVFFL